jgi:hypothetical protein
MSEDKKQPLIRVKMQNDVTDYPHNDVANAVIVIMPIMSRKIPSARSLAANALVNLSWKK